MKLLFSIAFVVFAFAGQSQNNANPKTATDPSVNALAQKDVNAGVQPTESASAANDAFKTNENSDNSGNAENKIETEKKSDTKINNQHTKNKKGRRGSQNTWVYIAVGVVAIAVILYLVGSAGVNKS